LKALVPVNCIAKAEH